MARRGENIRKRKDGRWEGRYIKARTPEGKIQWGYVYGTAYAEVKRVLIQRKAETGFYNLNQTDLTFDVSAFPSTVLTLANVFSPSRHRCFLLLFRPSSDPLFSQSSFIAGIIM